MSLKKVVSATYDPECDMGYIRFLSPARWKHVDKTLELRKKDFHICVDLNKEGQIIGIEVFDAKKRFPEPLMKSAKILK